MKVLILTSGIDGSSGGWGRYSSGLMNALRAAGTVCRVLTAHGGGGDIELLPPYANYRLNYLLAPLYAWRLHAYAKECDVIHAFVEPYAPIATWLSRFSGKPYFVTAHGTYATMPYRYAPPFRYIHQQALAQARAVVAVSTYTKQRLEEKGLRNLAVIQNGIESKDFAGRIRSFEERDNLIITIGGLKRRKGQHIALVAFARIAERLPSLQYQIIGEQTDAKYFTELQELVRKHHLEERVIFRKGVSDAELVALYCRTKALILTSLSDGTHFEGFGLVYLEANACGTPTIGARETGAVDAINDGTTGILVTHDNPESTADALRRLLSDVELWKRMSAASIEWARAHDWKIIVRQYTALYNTP